MRCDPGGNTGAEAVCDDMARIKTGFLQETEQAFTVFRHPPRFRRTAAFPMTRKIDDHETMIPGDPVCNRLHQLDTASPSVQKKNAASAVPGSFVMNSDTVNFFKHKFLLSGSNLPDIPAFHTAEFIFFLQVTGNR